MANINDLYNLSQYVIRKTRGSFQTVAEFNQNIWSAYKDAVAEWYSQYGKSQVIHDALRPMRVYQSFTSDTSGFVLFPSDYMHLLGTPMLFYGSTISRATFVNEDEIQFALTSQVRAVDMSNPILVDYATTVSGIRVGGFSCYPQQTQIGAYWYLRLPVQPVLSVIQVGRVVTYDPLTSVQIESSEIYWDGILAKSLKFVGINMSEAEVAQFGQAYANETNANNLQ